MTVYWQCIWLPKSSGGDVQWDSCSTLVNTTSIPQPIDQGVTSALKPYYLRNAFPRVITALESDPFWWIWANLTEDLLEKIHHSRCHEGHSWFMGFMGSNTNINRSLEEVDSNPQGRLCGVQDFSGERNCRCGGSSKRTGIRNGV